MLVNHDENQRAGAITRAEIRDGKLIVAVRFLSTAKGRDFETEVKEGALRGVSIGYAIHRAEHDEETRTFTAVDWEPYEVSLTPIPADPSVGIGRDASTTEAAWSAATAGHRKTIVSCSTTTNAAPLSGDERKAMDKTISAPADNGAAIVPAIDHRAIATQAEALGLRASDYVGMNELDARGKMLADVAESRKASAAAAVRTAPATVNVDESDKVRDEAVAGVMAGRSVLDIFRRHAVRNGDRSVADCSRSEMVERIFNAFSGKRAAEVSANFAHVTGLATAKFMQNGFDSYTPWSDELVRKQTASDFKTVRAAGVQLGDFSEPAEGVAFSDLTIEDAGASGALTYRGALLELTKQAIYNDELGIFFQKIRDMGVLARRHQDIKVAAALSGADFTNAALAATAFSSAALATAWTAFMAITGPAGQKPGYAPRKLVVPSALYITALEAVTTATGEATKRVLAGGMKDAISVVHGLHLTDANDWYLMADPNEAAMLTVVTHTDYATPLVVEIDAGGVASRKFRVEYPMAVLAATMGTTKPVGAAKATVV